MVQSEFQAVVFAAGKGSRMPELTSGTPKCLLPIGPKPLVWYPLQMLEHAGFTDAIIIVLESQKADIQTALDKTDLSIRLDFFSVPTDDNLGTAESLRMLGDKIRSDIVCVSCDLITDLDLCDALDVFRRHNASLVSVLFRPDTSGQATVPGPKAKHKPERDLIGIDAGTQRLVFQASASDFEENLALQKSLLRKHPHIILHSSLTDGHLYVMKKWICDYLQDDKAFTTLKGELVPFVVRKQNARSKRSDDRTTVSVVNDAAKASDIVGFAIGDEWDAIVREKSAFNDHVGDMQECYHGDVIRCFAHVPAAKVSGWRVNTLMTYWQVNQKIFDIWSRITYGRKELQTRDPKADIQSNQVDDKCIIWESAKLSERTSFKNANLGPNCTVHTKTRVFNSIVMSNVVVEERCAIENCIVCDGAVIGSGTNIKDCLVGAQHLLPAESQHAKEVLTDSDKLMEF